MAQPFLSDAWFDEVEKIRGEAPEPAAQMRDLKLNVVVTGGPDGDRDIRLDAGQFERGHVEGAPTKLTVPYDVAKAIFIDGDPQAGMQAFMSGKIKVEGDMSKVMAMQSMSPSPEQQAFQEKLKALTA